MSISLWLRVISPYSSTQTVFMTGSTSWDTGFLLRVTDSAKYFIVRMIKPSQHLYIRNASVHDTLATWTHVVLAADTFGNSILI